MNLSSPVTSLPYVDEKYQKLLKKLDIETLSDLLHHFPSRYEDYSTSKPIAALQAGDRVTLTGTIMDFRLTITSRKGLNIQEAMLQDPTGSIKLIWFNQPFLRETIKKGVFLSVAGAVEIDGRKPILKNPEFEIGKGLSLQGHSLQGQSFFHRIHTGRLVPIYPETAGVSSKWMRSKIAMLLGIGPYGGRFSLLPILKEWLPFQVLQEHQLLELHQAIRSIHFPNNLQDAERAKHRLAMDELVTLQLAALERKKQWRNQRNGKRINIKKEEVSRFIDLLPFSLTLDQQRSVDEILEDLSSETPMNRLLEGDVGSGKTVVAAAATFAVIKSGYQVAFMAPTQVLADQHGETLESFLEPLGVKMKLLTGAISKHEARSTKHEAKQENLATFDHKSSTPRVLKPEGLRSSTPRSLRRSSRGLSPEGLEEAEWPQASRLAPDLLIGTHALIYDKAGALIDPDRLALVVIDEQHRFGVSQRAQLVARGVSPHILSMTATPIPRTVALTLFADLDLSMLTEKPVGRLPVKTWVVPEPKRVAGYEWIKKQLKDGAQTFIVCPFIDPSEHDTTKTVKATTEEFEKLKEIFLGFRLAMLHGRMSAKEKTDILSSMKQHDIDILVSTPVVEVGVDVPGATIMVVEGAERFGLAQLHQLRGRVGRRDKPSYCLLFTTDIKGSSRLKIMETTDNGMMLAHMDLKRRGPGELWGTAQHGWPTLRVADLTNLKMVQEAYLLAHELSSQKSLRFVILNRIKPHLDKKVAPN